MAQTDRNRYKKIKLYHSSHIAALARGEGELLWGGGRGPGRRVAKRDHCAWTDTLYHQGIENFQLKENYIYTHTNTYIVYSICAYTSI